MRIPRRLRLGWCVPLLVFSAAALADNAMTTESADLYAGPDDSYPVVAELDSNSPVQVMGCLDDWSWCDVVADDTRGWMFAPDITYAYQGGYVPLYSYAPSLGIAVVPFSVDVYWGRYYHGRPWYSQREEWAHRDVRHRRPSGPPPSAGPPPRPEHREGPRVAERPDRPDNRELHLGRAEPQHQDQHPPAEHRPPPDNRNMLKRPEPSRSGETPRPAEPPRPESHATPSGAHEAPHQPAHEEHGRPAERAPPHEDHRNDDHPH